MQKTSAKRTGYIILLTLLGIAIMILALAGLAIMAFSMFVGAMGSNKGFISSLFWAVPLALVGLGALFIRTLKKLSNRSESFVQDRPDLAFYLLFGVVILLMGLGWFLMGKSF